MSILRLDWHNVTCMDHQVKSELNSVEIVYRPKFICLSTMTDSNTELFLREENIVHLPDTAQIAFYGCSLRN